MPLYEFFCPDCQREQELLVRHDETPVCEHCGSKRLSKLLSVPIAHSGSNELGGRPGNGPGPCGSHCGCHPH
jgi:putative FmdB family regulatory protein